MATANLGNEKKETGFNTFAVVSIVLAVVIFIYGFSLFMQGGFQTALALEKEAKVMNSEDFKTRDALAEQEALLQEGVRWIDQEKGTVGLPIEDAKALLVKQEARKESSF